MNFSWTCRIQNSSKNQNLYPHQSRITFQSLLWDTLYFRKYYERTVIKMRGIHPINCCKKNALRVIGALSVVGQIFVVSLVCSSCWLEYRKKATLKGSADSILHIMAIWVVEFSSGRYKRVLPKNQHTQRKWLNFENWVNGEGIILESKVICKFHLHNASKKVFQPKIFLNSMHGFKSALLAIFQFW